MYVFVACLDCVPATAQADLQVACQGLSRSSQELVRKQAMSEPAVCLSWQLC